MHMCGDGYYMENMQIDFEKVRDTNTTLWRSVQVTPTILDEDERLVKGRINTTAIDAYNTIIEPSGAEVEGYLNYASVLFNHHSDQLIGNAKELEQTDDYIDAVWRFLPPGMDSELTDYVWRLYKDGWLNGYSIGFMPEDWEYDTIDDIDVVICTEWILKEFSLTSVPANPEGLARSDQALKDWQKIEKMTRGVRSTPLMTNGIDLTTRSKKTHKAKTRQPTVHNQDLEVREVTKYRDLPIAEVDEWDADEAVADLRKWAGGPDKEDIDWDKYFVGFFWRDGDEPELYGSYKLPYAVIVDDEPKAADRGIYAVAQALQGAREDLDIPEDEQASIRNQVEKYYDKMGEEAPWNKEDTADPKTPEEVKNINMTKDELRELMVEVLEEERQANKQDADITGEDIEALNGKIDTFETELSDSQDGLSELKTQVEELEDQLEVLTENITRFVSHFNKSN